VGVGDDGQGDVPVPGGGCGPGDTTGFAAAAPAGRSGIVSTADGATKARSRAPHPGIAGSTRLAATSTSTSGPSMCVRSPRCTHHLAWSTSRRTRSCSSDATPSWSNWTPR
jgi:hypothetical protein